MEDKLTEWYHVRISKPLHESIIELPLERRQVLSNAVRKLLATEARTQTSLNCPDLMAAKVS